jgi:hypothetical protein
MGRCSQGANRNVMMRGRGWIQICHLRRPTAPSGNSIWLLRMETETASPYNPVEPAPNPGPSRLSDSMTGSIRMF